MLQNSENAVSPLALQIGGILMSSHSRPCSNPSVFDVLEIQARSALLPDAIISSILGHYSINVSYEPMECPGVSITQMEEGGCLQ
ncbi:hypothetical protein KIN20_021477 [Parelaphostrongylus tenuis]|uniref:Uncharacterized protein n=1 Tax=Parelaphostrongylus tenuis TaxID=148309 RepID=A0AAD5QUM6_PARTN|nr:hypothetical protein KIN20_021477 [Parelaphostrongylus tenuis]